MIDIRNLLCCPVCKGELNRALKCSSCSREYDSKDGIFVMLDPELSKVEWKWDEDQFDSKIRKEKDIEYRGYFNEATIKAHERWWKEMKSYIKSFRGYVLDIASGLGGMFRALMETDADFTPIASDVDPNVIAWTAKQIQSEYSKILGALVTDAKHLAIKNECLDVVTSYAGLNNIPDPALALAEIYRVLKKTGELVLMQTFVDENSRSAELGKQYHVEDSLTENIFIKKLEGVGFKNIKVKSVASAVWAENPMDLLPVAGDEVHYTIIEATK